MVPSFILSAVALLASTACAQYGSDYGSASPTAAIATGSTMTASPPAIMSSHPGQVMVQVVQVSNSNGSLMYYPEKINAAPGSWVQFQFHPKNHTVTESSFAAPCVPIGVSNTSVTNGVKSGFMPVAATDAQTPVFSLLVNDTKPIWLYCGQTGHCEKGMAMVINEVAGSPNNLAAYKAAAALISANSTGSANIATSTIMATNTAVAASTSTTASTTGATPAKFTGAAARLGAEGALGFGALFAGLAFVL